MKWLSALAVCLFAGWTAQAEAGLPPLPEGDVGVRPAGGGVFLAQAPDQKKGAAKDYTEARKWFQRAAKRGHKNAQYMLGLLYYNGKGVERNCKESKAWFQRAAEQGHAEAQYMLGLLYYDGKGGQKDYNRASEWFRKAAGKGDKEAQYMLGIIHYERAKGAGESPKN